MPEPLHHFADRERLTGDAWRARIHAYPRYYRDGDPQAGAWAQTDCSIVPSDHPELSDWMAKRGVWSLYGRNDGVVCYKHLGRALVLELRALVVVKADRSFEVIRQAQHGTPTIAADRVIWADAFAGIDREVQAIPDQFRDVFTISPQARADIAAWLQAHGYAGQLEKCYLAFAYKLAPIGFDGAAQETFDFDMDADGEPFSQQTAKESFGRINFRAAGRVKQFIDAGAFTAIDDPSIEQASVPKLKRFFRYGGDWWFLEGARLDQLAALPAGRIRANATATFQEGVSGYSGWGHCCMSYGAKATRALVADNVPAGTGSVSQPYRSLLHVDVSSIDPTATVNSATWTLTYVSEYQTTDRSNYLYKMLKPWHVPSASHDPASDADDDPCWTHQYYDETQWAAGGAGSEDVDRDTDVVASAVITSAAPTAFNFQSESVDALVEGWIQGTIANYGVLVCGQEGGANYGKSWATQIHATASYRPLLTVDYTVPQGVAVSSRRPFNPGFNAGFNVGVAG